MFTLRLGDEKAMPEKQGRGVRDRVKEVIAGRAHVRIGKHGLTDGVINEIKRLLESETVIKIRVMRSLKRSGVDIDELAKEVASKVNAKLIDVRGNVFVLLKRRK